MTQTREKRQINLRSMYIAPKGYTLVSCDLSQAESWIVAFLANDPNMKYSLQYSDIHKDTAAFLYYNKANCQHSWDPPKGAPSECKLCKTIINKYQRYIAKKCNHAKSYRMKHIKMAQSINENFDKPPFVTVSLSESKRLSDLWEEYYSLVTKGWWNDLINELRSNDCTLRTPYGRVRKFYQIWGDELFKEATAYIPQSTISDHTKGVIHPELNIKGGLREIYYQLVKPYIRDGHKIVNEKHDSVTIEVPIVIQEEMKERMKQLMERPLVINDEEFIIPVDVEEGDRWDGSSRDDG